jgi:restriction endonuclease S subunit
MSRSPDPFLLPGNSAAKGSPAPKGRNIPAQGNALGPRPTTNLSPEGAAQGVMPMIPLGQIAEVKLGKMLDKSKHTTGKKFPYLRNINVRWGRIDTSDLSEMFFKESEAERFSVNPGDVLVCEGGEPGRAAVWKGDHTHLKYQKALHRVRFLHEYDPRLLLYYLELLASRGALESRFTGSTIKHFTREAFIQLPVPNPPLPEQRRIVARIEELFSRLDAGVAALSHAKAQLKRYRQSVLAAAVTGQLTQAWREQHPKAVGEWSHTTLGEIAQIIDPNPSHRYPSYDGGTIPLLATKQMEGVDGWDASSAKLTTDDFHHERETAHGFEKTDVIFARKGRLGLARRPPDLPAFTFSHTVFIIRGDKRVTPNFLLWVLRPEGVVTWLLRELNTGAGVPTLGKAILAKLPLRLPPLAEQNQIVAEVEARTTAIDHLEAELGRQITRSNRLRQSTLASAFKGEL